EASRGGNPSVPAGNHNLAGNLDGPAMSRQSRQRRRRHRRGGPTRFLLIGGGVVVVALVIGTIAAVGYVLNVEQSAPAIRSLRPILGGGSSQVFASDGTRLGFIQSDQLRTPVSWSQIPTNL